MEGASCHPAHPGREGAAMEPGAPLPEGGPHLLLLARRHCQETGLFTSCVSIPAHGLGRREGGVNWGKGEENHQGRARATAGGLRLGTAWKRSGALRPFPPTIPSRCLPLPRQTGRARLAWEQRRRWLTHPGRESRERGAKMRGWREGENQTVGPPRPAFWVGLSHPPALVILRIFDTIGMATCQA